MSNSPAFQLYAADFLVGAMGLSDAEVGVYLRMLLTQWLKGPLPSDPKAIRQLVGSKAAPTASVLAKFSTNEDGMLVNLRLEKERSKQAAFRETRANNAKKRWDKESASNARASEMHAGSICKTDALQSSSSSSDKRERESAGAGTRRPSLDYAMAAASQIGVTPEMASEWWHAREASDWMKGAGGGATVPVGSNWQADLKTYAARMAGSAPRPQALQQQPKKHAWE